MRNEPGYKARVGHILEAIREIETYLWNMNFEQFINNSPIRFATIKQLEIVGEAANKITPDLQRKFPDVSWAEIIAFRNILIHEYFGVDLEIVWDIVLTEIPNLKGQMEAVYASLINDSN